MLGSLKGKKDEGVFKEIEEAKRHSDRLSEFEERVERECRDFFAKGETLKGALCVLRIAKEVFEGE